MSTRTMCRCLAAALALGAFGAAPAAAIQHEITGSFSAQYVVSNFNGTPVTANFAYDPAGLPADPGTADYFEQRLRLGYTARFDDRLKLVTNFELDYAYYGNSSYDVGGNGGGALGSNGVNLETKWVYLDYIDPATAINARVGMQEYIDGFEGVLIWSDAAGVALARPFGAALLSAGYFRLFDEGEVLGDATANLLALDASYEFAEGRAIGGAYYLVNDDRGAETVTTHTVGANASLALGATTLNGFALYQFGDLGGDVDVAAFAVNAGAALPLGRGTLRTEFLYASGDDDPADDKSESLQTYYGEYWYGSHGLALLTRDDLALTTDNGVVYDVAFGGRGSMIASAGYDLPLGEKTGLSFNLGAGWAAEDFGHEGSLLGTEANVKLDRILYPGLLLTARVAYLFLGDFYDGVAENGDDPDDPWDARVVLAYAF